MKRILSLIVIAAVCSTLSAAGISFPGWKCTDQAKITAALQQPGLSDQLRVSITCIQRLAEKPAKNFADLSAVVEQVAKENNLPPWAVVFHKKQLALCRQEFLIDAWKFCQANPSNYDIYYYKSPKTPISAEERYNHMIKFCIENSGNVHRHQLIHQSLNVALDFSDDIAPEKIKKDLMLLNRKMSKNLLQDKAGWEPMIATIRTTLECY